MIKLCAFADEAGETLKEQISALLFHHISYIEVRNVNGKNVLDLSDREANECYELLKKNNISVWSIGSPIGKVDINSDLDEYMKKVERICQIANIMHANNVRMFSFFHAYEQKDKVIKYLNKMVEIGHKYKVRMCHENEKEIYGDSLIRVKEILKEVPGLYSVYDPANFVQCGQNSEETLKELFPRSFYFHIKDCIASTLEVVPSGFGDGNIKKLINLIHDDKVLTIEPHLKVFKGSPETSLKNKFVYKTNTEAFSAAVIALKNILKSSGYKEVNGNFIK